jgi:hypothetical protein
MLRKNASKIKSVLKFAINENVKFLNQHYEFS